MDTTACEWWGGAGRGAKWLAACICRTSAAWCQADACQGGCRHPRPHPQPRTDACLIASVPAPALALSTHSLPPTHTACLLLLLAAEWGCRVLKPGATTPLPTPCAALPLSALPLPALPCHPCAALKWVMAVFDLPEAIAVGRTAMCTAGGLAAVTRMQAAGYYLGVLAYYW